MMLRTLPLVALAAYASAQTLPTISDTCTNTLKSIALNADVAACLNPVALISLISGNSSTSITPAIDNWLTGLCAAPACSNATISAVVTNVTAGCSSELSTEGVTTENNAQISELIQQYYPTVRKIACLKDGSSFCVSKELSAFETAVGEPLSLDNIVGLILNPPTALSSNVTCTNCVKESYNIIKADIPQAASLLDETSITGECGASFVDGSTPEGITQSAVQTVQGTTGSSGGNGASGISSSALVAFSGVISSALLMLFA